MKISDLKWLLCATILSAQPALAADAAKLEKSSSKVEFLAIPVIKPEHNDIPEITEVPKTGAPKAVVKKAKKPKKKAIKDTAATQDKNSKESSEVKADVLPTAKGFTLDDAISKALAGSPRLKAFASGIAAAKGEQQQAGVWSNPEIGIDTENLSGTGPYKGIDSVETTFGVSQQIQIGGKISARQNIADKGLKLASLEEQSAALDIIRDVTIAYADAVAAEENARLAREQKDLANDVLKSVSVRVDAAAAPLIQKSRAEVERSASTIALDKATREGQIARKKLAVLMGEESFVTPLDTTAFYDTKKTELSGLEKDLKGNPDLLKLDTNLEQFQAKLELEKANAVPDPTISFGVRDYRESKDQAFVLGFSIPIPVFDSNSGNIERARNEVLRAEMDNRQFALNTTSELTQAKELMENSHLQATVIEKEILPSATRAFSLSREGYNVGRFPYLEVLDAQRSLSTAKQQQIEAMRIFHNARAQVERITAKHLEDIQKTNPAPEPKGQQHPEHKETSELKDKGDNNVN